MWRSEKNGGATTPPLMCRVPKKITGCLILVVSRVFVKKKPPPFHRRFTANFGKSTRNCAKSSIVFLKLVYENGGILDMAEVKKHLTISLAKNVFEDLEKMAKDKGLSKSALLTVAVLLQSFK